MKFIASVSVLCLWLCSIHATDLPTQILLNLYVDCARTDWESCMKIKILSTMEKLRNARAISVADGITLVNENFIADVYQPFTEKSLEEGLPRNLDDRDEVLNSLLFENMLNWISKYTLRWRLSNLKTAVNEARGKKKYTHLLMMPLMMVASFIPLALGTLAILAGKALIVGKMALLLTAIIGIRKLFSKSHEEDEHQRAMKRISDFGMRLKSDMMMAQKMAYRGQSNEMHSNM